MTRMKMSFDDESLGEAATFPNITNAEVVLIKVYNVIGCAVSLLGNTFVIASILLYKALEFDKIIVYYVLIATVTSLLVTLLFWIPSTITIFCQRWVLGKVLCYLQSVSVFLLSPTMMYSVVLISCYKLYSLLQPLHAAITYTKRVANCVTFIVVVIVTPAMFILILSLHEFTGDVRFMPSVAGCAIASSSGDLYLVSGIYNAINALVPLLIILGSNIWILVIVWRVRKANVIPMKAIRTLVAVCGVFITSYLPLLVTCYISQPPPSKFERMSLVVVNPTFMLSQWCNPILFTLTNNRLRRFMRSLTTNGNSSATNKASNKTRSSRISSSRTNETPM